MGQQQRELKFRAWDSVDRVMKDPFTLSDIAAGYDCGYRVDKDLPLVRPHDEDDRDFIMQYTGLKDKDGREVYEGDIIEAKHYAPQRYLVEFIEGGFCLTHPKLNGYPMDINLMYPSTGCMFKVIGNIYENEELRP
jgi:hypothetical protein